MSTPSDTKRTWASDEIIKQKCTDAPAKIYSGYNMSGSSIRDNGRWGQWLTTTETPNNVSYASATFYEHLSNTTERIKSASNTTEKLEEIISVGILFYIVVMATFLAFAICSNCLVIYCVVKFTALRTVTNIFICNLSVSDILLAGFVMPQRLHDIFHQGTYHEGVILCKVINFFPIVVISSSIYTLVAVSFERRQVMMSHHFHRQRISNRVLVGAIFAIWIISLGVSTPSLIEYTVQEIKASDNERRTHLSCGSQFTQTLSLINAIFVFTMSYGIPVILLSKNYLNLAKFVWAKGKWIRENLAEPNTVNSTSVRLFKQRSKIVKLLFVVAVIFAASWLPFFVILIYAKSTGNDASENASGFINLLLIALAIFSTAYNVILYVIFNPSFKQAIIGVLKCTSASEVNEHVSTAESGQSPVSPQETPLSEEGVVNVLAGSSTSISVFTTKTEFTDLLKSGISSDVKL